MNILFTYIRKHLISNKLSTLISVFSISCASAMFFIVTCIGINSIISVYNSSINTYGNYHTVYTSVSDEFIESLHLHTKVEAVNEIEFKQYFNTNITHGTKKDSLYLLGIDEPTFDDLKLKMIEGRFPFNHNEILVSDEFINHTDQTIDVGSIIQLNNESYKLK